MRYESVELAGLAERLVAARKAANLTQEDAANHLKMSRPTFIAIEKGTRRPKPAELVDLAQLYGVPLNTLLRQTAAPEPLRPHLRSILDFSTDYQRELESAISLLSAYIDDYQYLQTLMQAEASVHFPSPVHIPPGPIERFAEHCAQEERARLNLGAHQPIYGLRKTLEEAGLHVFVDKLDSKLAGLYVFVPNFGYCILINRSHPRDKRRWTIAHEYGHFLTDRDRPGVDYLQPMQRKPGGERFSDAFAAAFLMPEPGIQRRFYEEIERTGDFKVGDLCRLADYFGVSVMAMALRLQALGLIPRSSWDQIADARVPIRALKKEAGLEAADELGSPKPYPQRYKMLAVQAYADQKISEGQLARFLRCSRVEARQIVDQWSMADTEDARNSVSLALTDSLLSEPGK
jgi:Zn-dependent peptidase ImmA (M78 family)/transcriptional regulator with XRE-family HTH domain